MKNLFAIFLFALVINVFMGCDKDDYPGIHDFVVAFDNPSENFSDTETRKDIRLVFSQPAPEDGFIEIEFSSESLIYGEDHDFVTDPEGNNGKLKLSFSKGNFGANFSVQKLQEVLPGEEKQVSFRIVSVEIESLNAYSQGNTDLLLVFSESASMGGTLRPNVGGPNQPNQVYVSLRSKSQVYIRRDAWDLGFYSGEDFHVKLNSSIFMFAGALDFTDIDQVREADVEDLKPLMNFLVEGSDKYVDHPDGSLNKLAIQAISEHDDENPVYLLKMGNEIGTDTPAPGGVAVSGAERGWKKIRILRRENSYLLQYADLNSSNHREIRIEKNEGFNFTFFNLNSENPVLIEPERTSWDLNFTVSVAIEDIPGGEKTAYGYPDYVEMNNLGNVRVYKVTGNVEDYQNFSVSDIDEGLFSSNRGVIGSSWRGTLPPNRGVRTNIFFVVKDSENNFYKLRFTAFENENGERGHPEFEYKLLR